MMTVFILLRHIAGTMKHARPYIVISQEFLIFIFICVFLFFGRT